MLSGSGGVADTASSPWNGQFLCKDEMPATVPCNQPLSDSLDPVPGLSAPTASPGLLDGFSFFFTETDTFGCPVVTDDVSSPPFGHDLTCCS